METQTLDFNDLIDSDEQGTFPGFEIAKFSPITDVSSDKAGDNSNDKILRTPEPDLDSGAQSDENGDNDNTNAGMGDNKTDTQGNCETESMEEENDIESTYRTNVSETKSYDEDGHLDEKVDNSAEKELENDIQTENDEYDNDASQMGTVKDNDKKGLTGEVNESIKDDYEVHIQENDDDNEENDNVDNVEDSDEVEKNDSKSGIDDIDDSVRGNDSGVIEEITKEANEEQKENDADNICIQDDVNDNEKQGNNEEFIGENDDEVCIQDDNDDQNENRNNDEVTKVSDKTVEVEPVENQDKEVMNVDGDKGEKDETERALDGSVEEINDEDGGFVEEINDDDDGEGGDDVQEIVDDAEDDFTIEINDDSDDDNGQKSSGSDVEEVEDIADNSNNSQDDKDKKEHDTSDDVHIVDSEPKPNIHNMDLEEKKLKKPARAVYMLPPSKRKKVAEAERVETIDLDDDDVKEVNGDDDHKDKKSRSSSPQEKDKKVNGEPEEESCQQSFLSFLNLKPGSAESNKKKKEKEQEEEEKQQEFFSRKRLRTRKKVNYTEDVVDDSDDDYEDEEEEEDRDDHVIDVDAPSNKRRRSAAGVIRRTTPSKRTPSRVNPLQAYAKALSNIVPGSGGGGIGNFNDNNSNRGFRPALPKQQFVIKPPIISGSSSRTVAPGRSPTVAQQLAGVRNNSKTPTITTVYQSNVKGLFECGICGVFYNSAELFIKHQQDMHATSGDKLGRAALETFRCEICSFVLTNRFAYLEHKRMKHTKQQLQFTCTRCPKTFNYLVDLQKHKTECKQKTNLHHCPECQMKFTRSDDLLMHQKTHHQKNWFHCQNRTCDFKSQSQADLKAHVQKKHMVSELFPCNVPRCARVFSTKEQLIEHQKAVHGSDFIVQYQCMECKGCYSSKTLLAEHQYLHTTDRMKKCDICMREFPTLTQLLKHKDVHVCKGTVQCLLCTRWCMDDAELSSHLCKAKKQVQMSRLYFCDVCKKDFRSDEKMFAHRKEHYKYFQCGTCFMETETEEEYFEHREIHSIYTCRICAEEFESQGDLETHKKAHDFYVKMDHNDDDSDGEEQPTMYLCPNVLKALSSSS